MSYKTQQTKSMHYKRLICMIAALTSMLSGCSIPFEKTNDANTSTLEAYLDSEDMFSERDKEIGYDSNHCIAITLQDNASTCEDSSVTIAEHTITLTKEGTYLLSGSLSNGQIVVDAPEDAKLQLVLNNTEIQCDANAAIYIKQADKVFLTLAAESTNTLATTSAYKVVDENNVDAVIFSKADLTLNGSGSLSIESAYGHGIVSKDDLIITGGTYEIAAASHALSGKDSVRIADGTFHLTAGKDGIHSENADDLEKGFVYISDGNISIESQSDGIDGDNTVQIEGGTFDICAGDDGIHSDSNLLLSDGSMTVSQSKEGLEGMTINIDGGTYHITSSDDGLNAAGNGKNGTDDAGNSSDEKAASSKMPEMPEDTTRPDMPDASVPSDMPKGATPPEMPDGATPPEMPDGATPPEMPDGSAPSEITEGGRFGGGGFGGGSMEATDYNYITINGGTVYIHAQGDGIDSNGNLTVTGGEIYISGPTSGADGALDYAGNAVISGGTVVAVGASRMAMNFGSDSTQGSMLVTLSDSSTDAIALCDDDDNLLIAYTPESSYNSVLISCPALKKGETYTLTSGDITTAIEMTSLISSR